MSLALLDPYLLLGTLCEEVSKRSANSQLRAGYTTSYIFIGNKMQHGWGQSFAGVSHNY